MARYFALAENGFITWNCFSWWGAHTRKSIKGCVYVNGYISTVSTFHNYYISHQRSPTLENEIVFASFQRVILQQRSRFVCRCGYACFYKQNVLQVVRCNHQLCLLKFFITKFRFVFKLKTRTCKTCNLLLAPEKFNYIFLQRINLFSFLHSQRYFSF